MPDIIKTMTEIELIKNSEELKSQLFIRKHELMQLRIHGTLKKEPSAVFRKRKLISECQKITGMIEVIRKENLKNLKVEEKNVKIDNKKSVKKILKKDKKL